MHKLRHPIAVFIATVLTVIGIGVGVVAATTTEPVYGPSWGRFTATFPGRMRVIYSPPVPSASFGDPLRYTTTFYYANQHFNGWVGYAPLQNNAFRLANVGLHPWVRLVIWLLLVVFWTLVSTWLLRPAREASQEGDRG